MIRKFISRNLVSILASLLLITPVSASLWNYYQERGQPLPSIPERREIALQNGFESYNGSYSDNVALERVLRANEGLLGVAIPTVVANYEDSLASRITQTQTSTFTLVKGYDKLNRALNGYYGFIIDEGSASTEEYFLANCVGTSCTIVKRGIDVVDGSTQTSTLQHEHRRGASVKLTNFPQLALLSRILNGQETTPGGITFGTNVIYLSTTTAIRFNGTNLQWTTDNFSNSYNFTSSSISQLTASTTQGIQVNSSQIGVNASSTTGLAFGSDGALYQKVSSTRGILSDNNGLYIATTSPLSWSSTQTFATTSASTSTVSRKLTIPTPVDGTDAVTKTYADNLLYSAITNSSSLNLKFSNDSAVSATDCGTSFGMLKETAIRNGGTVNASYVCTQTSNSGGHAQLYRNGVAVGSDITCTGTNTTSLAVAPGDRIQVYAYCGGNGTPDYIVQITNFRLFYDESVTTTGAWVMQ